MTSYVSSSEKAIPTIWQHLETANRLPMPKHTRHKTIPLKTRYGRLIINSGPFKLEGYEVYVYYECLCDCGTSKVVRMGRLGKTVSCGCRMKESSSENGGQNKRIGPVDCSKCGKEYNYSGTICDSCRYRKHKKKADAASSLWAKKQQASPEQYLSMMLGQLGQRERRKAKLGKKNARQIGITRRFIHALWDKQNGKCALTGLNMEHNMRNPRSVSIDRIDSLGDYTEDNTQLICIFANLGKRDFKNQDIKSMINDIQQNAKLS